MMKKAVLILVLAVSVYGSANATVKGTPHDVNIMRSTDGKLKICTMCHTPHSNIKVIPLWNRTQSPQHYTMYESPTFDMKKEGNTLQSPSMLCMTCHNGITSTLVNYPGPGSYKNTSYDITVVSQYGNLGLNMKNNHPVSFTYEPAHDIDNNGFPTGRSYRSSNRKAIIGSNGTYPLYGPDNDQFECSTCHSVHDDVDYPGKSSGKQVYFLRADNRLSRMCTDCHTNR